MTTTSGFSSLHLSRFLHCTLAALLSLAPGHSSADSGNRPSALAQALGEARLSSWHNLLAHGGAEDERTKLREVNDFINRSVVYGQDRNIWGVDDFWATPAQTLTRGMGDCEDFAIAKYFSLVRLGVPSEKLRLTFVKALSQNQAHMVLAYYPSPSAQPLILDNLEARIKPASERQDLLPVYSFNDLGVFLAKAPQRASQPAQFLTRWQELSERALADGSLQPQPRG